MPTYATRYRNPPTSKVLAPGQSVTYGMRVSATTGGPRDRDAALAAAGEPVLRAVPGYTLATDMTTAKLMVVTAPIGVHVVSASSSNAAVLTVAKTTVNVPAAIGGTGGGSVAATIELAPASRGRARISVLYSDGSESVGHYMVLPSFPVQVANVGKHWSNVSWLPKDYPDPFGRGAAVLPWDSEDSTIRLNDARAYDVGLSDDAGGGNPLGFATKVGYAPTVFEASRLDEYINLTLYGVKNDTTNATARAPLKSLQYPDPNNGVRMTMFYYNQTHFPWNYTEEPKCGKPSGMDNWCMTEGYSFAHYRGFNYPHQIASYYGMYRVARYHEHIPTLNTWQWYLERALNTSIRLGFSKAGYMDGTVCREVLRSGLEEAEEAGNSSIFNILSSNLMKIEVAKGNYWKSAINPYGSEFAYVSTPPTSRVAIPKGTVVPVFRCAALPHYLLGGTGL